MLAHRAILGGAEEGPAQLAVVLAAVLRLWAAGLCDSVEEGLGRARGAIASGAAAASLDRLLESCA